MQDAALALYTWGRWVVIAAVLSLIVYRSRQGLRWQQLAREIALILVAYFAYFWVRGLTEGSEARAVANAARIINIERTLGFFWEPALQTLILGNHSLITLANWAYIWGHWPVIGITGLWLFLSRPQAYRLFRDAFFISGAIGLVIFMAFPVAPPRLTDIDVVDTVTAYSKAYRVLQPPALVNQYAAVPSLHVGWNLLVGIALVREAPWRWAKAFGVIMPVVMFLAIVLTANHYIVDGVAGAAIALTGLLLAQRVRQKGPRPAEETEPRSGDFAAGASAIAGARTHARMAHRRQLSLTRRM